MIQVTVGTATQRQKVTVAPDTTIKKVLTDNAVDYSSTTIMLDSETLNAEKINKTFAELGIKSDCMLIAVTKMNNAR